MRAASGIGEPCSNSGSVSYFIIDILANAPVLDTSTWYRLEELILYPLVAASLKEWLLKSLEKAN